MWALALHKNQSNQCLRGKNIKRVSKTISKFFHFNAIPFHALDNPYYQSMIDEIAKVGPGMKSHSTYQIGNEYLDKEFEEFEKYLGDIYDKLSTFGCTIMCDGWSTCTKASNNKFYGIL